MKKIMIIGLIISCISFCGCEKDVESQTDIESQTSVESQTEVESESETESETSEVVSEELFEPVGTYDLAEYEIRDSLYYKENEYYELKNDQLNKIETDFAVFSTDISYENRTFHISFQWDVVDGELYLTEYNGMYEYFHLQKIKGNTSEVLLIQKAPLADYSEVYLCHLEENTIEPFFSEDISEYGVYDMQISSDLGCVVLVSKEDAYYSNRKNFISMKEICGLDDQTTIFALLIDNQVLVHDNDNQVFYVYNPEDGSVRMTYKVLRRIDMYGERYATCYVDSKVAVVDLLDGDSIVTNIKREDVHSIHSLNATSFLVIMTDGRMFVIDKETGATVTQTEKSIENITEKRYCGITDSADGHKYIQFDAGNGIYEIYKID